MRSNALAKILAEPNLMALDGQPAQFIAGGLFPYPVPQSSSIPGGTAVVTVQFAKFGAILTFIPQILANDVIRLDVEPIFSQLNFASGTTVNGGKVPAIDQRSARTVVELREGQSLAIAGLLQTTTNANTSRIPGLGDLPIVGPWFSFEHIETIETELVVLVTPVLVAPMEAERGSRITGRPRHPAERLGVLLPGPDRRQVGPRLPRDGPRDGPPERDEALPQRIPLGRRPPWLRRLNRTETSNQRSK